MKKYVIKEEKSLTRIERKSLYNLLPKLLIWSIHVKKYLYYSSRPKWRLMLFEDGELVGSLSIVKRKVNINHSQFYIGGIGNVGIKKEYQGKGLAQKMLTYAEQFMKRNDINFGLLFYDDKRIKLYSKVGYQKLHKEVTYFSKSKLKREPIAMLLPIKLNREDISSIRQSVLHIGRGTW
ncbi:MAG: GNAT family N-acetyltransferase [bacterium]|nr:GNAT family N-acetyltransferase [bacterium]